MIRTGATGERRESNRMPIEDREQKTARRNDVKRRVNWEHNQQKEKVM